MSISATVPSTDQEEIFTTVAPIPLTASPPLRIFGASSYALLSTLSISLNALLITILLKNRKQYKKEPFFLLTWQLIACDVLTQIMQLIIAVPITYAGSPIYGEGLLLHSLGFIDTVAYYGTLFFSALMTVNRATIFFLPKINQALFTLPNIYGSIIFTWILLFVAPISLNAAGCYKNFATNGYYLYHDCQTPFSKQVYLIWYNIVAYLPVAMIVTYITIFVYLRYITRSASSYMSSQDAALEKERANRRREQRLLFQSFLICGSLEIQNLAFNYLPYLNLQGQWSYVLNFSQNWISIFLNSITPIVMFSFNADIQSRLRRLLRNISGNNHSVQPTTLMVNSHMLSISSGHRRSSQVSISANISINNTYSHQGSFGRY